MTTTVTPQLELGFSVALKGQVIDQRVIDNIIAMFGTHAKVRIMEDMATYNPKPNVYNFQSLDGTIHALESAGLTAVLPIHNPTLGSSFTTVGKGVCAGKQLLI